jgi:hypothetical protein
MAVANGREEKEVEGSCSIANFSFAMEEVLEIHYATMHIKLALKNI